MLLSKEKKIEFPRSQSIPSTGPQGVLKSVNRLTSYFIAVNALYQRFNASLKSPCFIQGMIIKKILLLCFTV